MPQSLTDVVLHVVFSTKGREPYLHDQRLREDTHAYVGGVVRQFGSTALVTGGVADHVHLLVTFPRTMTIADYVKETKRVTTHWLRTEKGLGHFRSQAGYGAFSVGRKEIKGVRDYIRRQADHHARVSFKDEFRRMLEEHGVAFDERYVWD